jgi:hypothetical protein
MEIALLLNIFRSPPGFDDEYALLLSQESVLCSYYMYRDMLLCVRGFFEGIVANK